MMSSSKKSLINVVVLLTKNPFLIAALLGVLSWTLKDKIPEGVMTYARFAAASAAPVSLFSLGIILASLSLKRIESAVWVVIVMNVMVVPLIVYSLLQVVEVSSGWRNLVLLMAAGPCGAMPFVIALQYRIPTERIAKAILVSTLLSLIALTAITS